MRKKRVSKQKECVCVVCGKTFIASRRTAKYCSKNCNMRDWRENPPSKIEKICICCGKPFTTRSKLRRVCSHSCAGRMASQTSIVVKKWKSFKEIQAENRKRKVESGWRGRKMQGSGFPEKPIY